jgi:hypothetical protein
MKQEDVSVCDSCGASVYKEHLESGIAKHSGGKLYCSHCVADTERKHGSSVAAAEDFVPIELDKEDSSSTDLDMSSSRIRMAVESKGKKAGAREDADYRRPLQPNGTGATRCRTFHCLISEGAVNFMNDQINEWIDGRDDITVKFATSVIGMFEGKHTEPNLILSVFY